jgi:hypothetical protein
MIISDEFKDFISILTSFASIANFCVTGPATILAAILGIIGIQTWKKQYKGKNNYELAQRLLVLAYKVRNAINIVRNPYVSAGEMSEAAMSEKIEGNFTNESDMKKVNQAVYRRRWTNIEKIYPEIETTLFEAEAVWGKEILAGYDKLKACIRTLNTNLSLFFTTPDREETRLIRNKIEKYIYGIPDKSGPDPFADEVDNAIKEIEKYLRQFMKL